MTGPASGPARLPSRLRSGKSILDLLALSVSGIWRLNFSAMILAATAYLPLPAL